MALLEKRPLGRASKMRAPIPKAMSEEPSPWPALEIPTAQRPNFFINVSNNDGTGPVTNLNYPHSNGHGYAVFGEVIEGMDVVDKIKEVSVTTIFMNSQGLSGRVSTGSHENVPVDPVLIQSIRRAD